MGRRTKQRRFEDTVMLAPDDFEHLDLTEVVPEPWMVEHLAAAEAAIRELRLRLAGIIAGQERTCAQCGRPMVGRADRKFCGSACRQASHRRRPAPSDDEDQPAA